MAVSLVLIRNELLPGLRDVYGRTRALEASWLETKEIVAANIFAPSIAAPHIWVPKLTLPQAAGVGAAAAIIKNPVISRRFWQGWRL